MAFLVVGSAVHWVARTVMGRFRLVSGVNRNQASFPRLGISRNRSGNLVRAFFTKCEKLSRTMWRRFFDASASDQVERAKGS